MGYPYPSFCLCAFLGPTLTCQGTGSCKVVFFSSHGWLSKLWFLFGSYLGFRVQYPKRDPHFDMLDICCSGDSAQVPHQYLLWAF